MKIQHFEDVGIKNLRDLTKEELIYCIEHSLEHNSSAKFWFECRLLDIADKRRGKKLKEDEEKGNKWINLMKEYEELLKPYKGVKIGDLPADVIAKGAKLERKIKKAREVYFATFGRETGAI